MDIEIKGTIPSLELDKWDVEELSKKEREKAIKAQWDNILNIIYPVGTIAPFPNGIEEKKFPSKMKWENVHTYYWKRIE